MGIAEETADRLAADVIRHIEATGDEDIITLIGKALGDSSQTLQEAFVTSVRVQRAAIRADQLIAARAQELAARGRTPEAAAAAPKPAPEMASAETQPGDAHEEDWPGDAGTAAPRTVEPEPNRAAQRARELLERRKAERAAAEEALGKGESEAAARKGRRAVPQVKTDPRLG
ncbi:hypothetical protein [Jannaschia formosa]|uniref:hypothetical protein n=1 Tax=Jannaschia formosa TaxID=2259592 RepID=UPI001FD7FC4F|nr:hypothetical protein [Jannaschia formosa]